MLDFKTFEKSKFGYTLRNVLEFNFLVIFRDEENLFIRPLLETEKKKISFVVVAKIFVDSSFSIKTKKALDQQHEASNSLVPPKQAAKLQWMHRWYYLAEETIEI